MRAGEAFWDGREELLSTIIDKAAPGCLDCGPWLKKGLRTGKFRSGFGMPAGVVRDYAASETGMFFKPWKVGMEAEIAANESTDRAVAAIEKLHKTLDEFRSKVKNDLSSMKAASERVQNEVAQMDGRYRAAQSLLSSPEFERAIANAERMAAALESISRLSETKLSVAVFSGGKAT